MYVMAQIRMTLNQEQMIASVYIILKRMLINVLFSHISEPNFPRRKISNPVTSPTSVTSPQSITSPGPMSHSLSARTFRSLCRVSVNTRFLNDVFPNYYQCDGHLWHGLLCTKHSQISTEILSVKNVALKNYKKHQSVKFNLIDQFFPLEIPMPYISQNSPCDLFRVL